MIAIARTYGRQANLFASILNFWKRKWNLSHTGLLPCSGQTLALAEPEARHYNHPATAPYHRPQQMFVLAISQPFLNGMS